MAGTSEYIFGLSLGLLILIICFLLTLNPHQHVVVRLPSPPPSPPLIPLNPDLPIEPYNEQALVSAFPTIYGLLLDLQYLQRDEIIFPPPSGHQINLELCRSLKLDDRVISLMQRLPYPKDVQGSLDFYIIDENRCFVYIDDNDVKDGRDSESAATGEELRLDYLLPTDNALTHGSRYGTSLVLDTKENIIRSIEYQDGPSFDESMERPDQPLHYRNYTAEPALEVLRRYAHKYRSLAHNPSRHGDPLSRWDRKKHPELKRRLMDEYGWPDNFGRDAWSKDHERLWYEIDHRFGIES